MRGETKIFLLEGKVPKHVLGLVSRFAGSVGFVESDFPSQNPNFDTGVSVPLLAMYHELKNGTIIPLVQFNSIAILAGWEVLCLARSWILNS